MHAVAAIVLHGRSGRVVLALYSGVEENTDRSQENGEENHQALKQVDHFQCTA